MAVIAFYMQTRFYWVLFDLVSSHRNKVHMATDCDPLDIHLESHPCVAVSSDGDAYIPLLKQLNIKILRWLISCKFSSLVRRWGN